ncbi:ABC transporter ATP-binding protein [Paenibacillus sp. UMB4589-SE434]|uniref:ABC transporter ATP-binding protein n=1 Tax=Paenibacillus sp. UMB4589-SE434 TaxID=3046314 RepID=UPI00254B0708|nr:ABC transporter ATP-binding protein [Paenibacillus sp. UMB4589-SE434]MDK8180241.1 ABC transporter ATP-binding protein [Paenibacillus sp. UMB4589-SE434]
MVDELVRFDMVHKVFKEKTVIGKVDLRVGRGEVVALCGGNGAGKSTLLRMLAGILHPTSGAITVNGLSWQADRRHYAQQIGYMPDDYRFSLGLTALETLHFWAKLRGLSKERVLEVLSLVGLSDKLNKQVSSFSKGMRQRVLFAQALLAAPPLIVMDEPTNGLDPYWMETFIHLVRQSASNGHTILFSTHQLQIAEALADRIVFLRDGNIVLDGKKEHIYQEHGADGLQQLFGELFGIRSGL